MSSTNSTTLLSTRSLSSTQQKLIQNAGFDLVELEAIKIEFMSFNWPKDVKNVIFSSKNAINSIKKSGFDPFLGKIENCYCVGETTRALLEGFGQKSIKMYHSASELAENVSNFDKNAQFHFFCGNARREEIPNAFKNSNIELLEIVTYKTNLNSVVIPANIDAVLFFSPSAVKSLSRQNNLSNYPAVCLGKTTAQEAIKYSKKVYIADTTSVESVITKAVKILKND